MYLLSSANFKKDPPRNIFSLSLHAPATSGWLHQRMTSTMMGSYPQFYVAGDQQGLERSVSQAEDCSCCKSHRRDPVHRFKICDCWVVNLCRQGWTRHSGSCRFLPIFWHRASVEYNIISDNQCILSWTGICNNQSIKLHLWSLTPSGTFTTTPSSSFVIQTWPG